MKKVKVLASGIFMFLSVAMFAQNGTNKLPANAQDFMSENFSSVSVQEVKENSSWQFWEDDMYEVRLANGIEVDFDKNGNILEIEGENNTEIPESALPSSIVSYVNSNYPNAQVVNYEKKNKGHEVELMNGTELEFDKNGSFLKID